MQPTKTKILDVMISYIKNGENVNNIAIAKIAQEADIGKSTIYEYFENKKALIEETYFYLLNRYETILMQEVKDVEFKTALMRQLSWILDVVIDAKSIMEVLLGAQNDLAFIKFETCSSKIKKMQDGMEDRFIEIIKIGLNSGEIKYINRPYQNNIIQSLITGLMFQYVDGVMDITREALLELIYTEIIRVLN
jgi:AcrR family transcriptional regulator